MFRRFSAAVRQPRRLPAKGNQPRQTRARDRTGDGHAGERKGRVKCWRSGTANDVGADPKPIGV
jgi:hypothetical protein